MTSFGDPARQDAPVGWIREIVMDCAEPWALARFWAGLVGGTPVEWYPGWVTIEPPPNGQRLSFQQVTDPPPGHASARPARVHFDILVTDLAAAHDRVVSGGAVFTAEHVSPRPGPAGEQVRWRVYSDPAGHAFCLVLRLRKAGPHAVTGPRQRADGRIPPGRSDPRAPDRSG